MKRLIAGIDPGAMVGWAVLDLEGKLLAIGSGKGFDLDRMVELLREQGRVIIIGSDKAKIPSFVQECATKLGAKTIGPQEDLRIDEKRSITKGYGYANFHEMDALSGALVGLKHFQTLFRKIKTHLRQAGKEELFEQVAELVIKKEIAISTAVKELEKMVEVEEKTVGESKPIAKAEVLSLQQKLASARIENKLLKKQLEQAYESLRVAQNRYENLKRATAMLVRPKRPEARIQEKEARIRALGRKIGRLSQEIELAKRKAVMLERALASVDKKVVLKKLANLGWEEVQKQKDFLCGGDLLLVDNPNQYSEKAVEWLKEKGIMLVLFKTPPSQRITEILPFAFLPANKLEIEEFERVGLADKEQIASLRHSSQVLKKLVEEYKKERAGK